MTISRALQMYLRTLVAFSLLTALTNGQNTTRTTRTTTLRTTATPRTTTTPRPTLGPFVCYEELGCFYRTGNFSHLTLPDSPEEMQTKFYLFTHPNQTAATAELLDYKNPTTITQSRFMKNKPTRFFVHGFTSNDESYYVDYFTEAVFKKEGLVNCIIVDWEQGAVPPAYWSAAANTQVVGAQTARLIEQLINVGGTVPGNIHIVGASLGAQVAGFAGKRLQQFINRRIGRITAVDPAGPLFEGTNDVAHISKGDADFVEAIHGNGVPLWAGGLGMYQQVGDIDYYPNGGRFQPGCPHMILGSIGNIIAFEFGEISDSIICNHGRPMVYLLESFNTDCRFQTVPCESFEKFKKGGCTGAEYTRNGEIMDMYATNSPSTMKHFFLTPNTPGTLGSLGPTGGTFCGAHVKVQIKSSNTSLEGKGRFSIRLSGKNGWEDTPIVVAEEEKLIPNARLTELILSRIKVDDVKRLEFLYQHHCYKHMCWSRTVKIHSVVMEAVGYGLQSKISACFDNMEITSGVWSGVSVSQSCAE